MKVNIDFFKYKYDLIKLTKKKISSSLFKYLKDNTSTYEFYLNSNYDTTHTIKGRILNKRSLKNLNFYNIEIEPNKIIQISLNKKLKENNNDNNSKDNKKQESNNIKLKTGDIIECTGIKTKTLSGSDTLELNINQNNNLNVISQCFSPLPKYNYGLKDQETIYNKRYLDFIINSHKKELIILRHKVTNYLRNYLIKKNYIEVETPILSNTKSGAIAKPFITKHEALNKELYLRVAPEIHLKKLIISGFNNIFEIGKNFRNEDISTKHNPEFSSIELYSAYKNYKYMIELNEELLTNIFKNFSYLNNETLTNTIKFDYYDIIETLENLMHIKFKDVFISNNKKENKFEFNKLIKNYYENVFTIKYNIDKSSKKLTLKEMLEDIIEIEIENKCNFNNISVIMHHPIIISPLAKELESKNNDFYENLFSERFEVFYKGFEIVNAYSELNCYKQQEERFLEIENNHNIDKIHDKKDKLTEGEKDFIDALSYGMPPTAGYGLGIDRLVMILSNSNNIKDVISFPIMNKRQ